ncbi:MAG: hypothetical protein V1493_00650, partial [Candidatus Diapherotrites archaeon]
TGRKTTERRYVGPQGQARIDYPEKVWRGKIREGLAMRKKLRKAKREGQARKPGEPALDYDRLPASQTKNRQTT